MAIPKRVQERLTKGLRKYRRILAEATRRDVNEADTVTIVKGVLSDVLGWDPFFEVTSEYAIRGTFVDLAIKDGDHIPYLIEVKAIGADLRENHLRQVVGYGANHGVEWVVLTNGVVWQAHRITFGKPISHDLVFQLDLLEDNSRESAFRDRLFLLTKEGMGKAAIARFHAQRQAMSKFNIGAILRSDDGLKLVRRELRRAHPKLKPELSQIRHILEGEVLKRDVVEGERADLAVKSMKRASRPLRKRTPQKSESA